MSVIWPCEKFLARGKFSACSFIKHPLSNPITMGAMGTRLLVVSVPDPNQPQRGSLDPRWGWFGSGAETRLLVQKPVYTP